MTEQIDHYTKTPSTKTSSTKTSSTETPSIKDFSTELFNNGMCFFERKNDKGNNSINRCVNCESEVTSTRHPFAIIRICDTPRTTEEVLKINSVKLPSIIRLAGNFGIAYLRHKANGSKDASKETIDSRFFICKKCTLYYRNGRCLDCGCNVNDLEASHGLNKLAWQESRCKKGFWDAVTE